MKNSMKIQLKQLFDTVWSDFLCVFDIYFRFLKNKTNKKNFVKYFYGWPIIA